ncbi:hypothetical protein BOVATA_014890 [Babesia ovata]|uniref:Uncharacterized protein n=1 Tax=Babesia ovata TaxID=189622 RepID=A0A2H6KAI7_9APIC|nr:uncharacterized protein BOVATA_014890 [Babesia ovata]GBE59996.1 hypothetical protein BOVATA_014890 [Babesia ovata]
MDMSLIDDSTDCLIRLLVCVLVLCQPLTKDSVKLKCSGNVNGGLGTRLNRAGMYSLPRNSLMMSQMSRPFLVEPENALKPSGVIHGTPGPLLGHVEHIDLQPTLLTWCGRCPGRESPRKDISGELGKQVDSSVLCSSHSVLAVGTPLPYRQSPQPKSVAG